MSAVTLFTWFVLQIHAAAEDEDNLTEQKRQQGKKVLYGQIIQVGFDWMINLYHSL